MKECTKEQGHIAAWCFKFCLFARLPNDHKRNEGLGEKKRKEEEKKEEEGGVGETEKKE